MQDLAGVVLADRYALERELGIGGMATVWLARDLRHDRPVAVKVILPELSGALCVDRFLREVQLTARLHHPNIVPLIDSGVLAFPDGSGLPWYAMPYVEGESVRQLLVRERQITVEEALRITGSIASALEAAHRAGIVHRDIKPENVMLSGDNVYVMDFGIAKALVDTGGHTLTGTGLSIGTPAYMSPEQAAGASVDARSDQYSLATILYEMLTGEVPFTGSTAQAVIARRLAEPARPIRTVRPNVPAPVEHAVLKALERVPADRHANVAAFMDALRSERVPVAGANRRLLALVLVGVVLVVVMVGAYLLRRAGGPTVERDPEVLALYQRGMEGLAKRTDEGSREALTSLKAALERDSSYGAAWAGLALTYQQAINRRFVFSGLDADSIVRLAVAAVDRAMALDGRNAEVLYAQAMVARMVDPTNLTPILTALRQAVAIDPGSAHAWLRLGTSLYESGESAQAFEAWHRAVALDPAFSEALSFLGIGFMWSRQYDSAAYWADSAMAVNPNYLLALTTQGQVEVERGNYQRALAAFDAARRLSSGVEVPNALAGRALALARAGRSEEAIRLLVQVDSLMTRYVPTPSHNAVYIAAAWAALGDTLRAVRWLAPYSPVNDKHFQVHLRCDPAFDPIAFSAQFQVLLEMPRPGPAAGC